MSNVVTRNASVAAALAAAESFTPSGKGYMKLNANTGIYTYGKDEKELPAGSELAVNMKAFALGWICWKDEEVVAEIMARPFMGEIPIANEAELPDHGPFEGDDGWSKQASVDMKILDTGEDIQLKLSSKSGVAAMNKLLREYAKELPQRGDDAVIIITTSTNSFMPKEKKYGKKYAPVFEIVEWTTEAKLAEAYPAGAADDESSYEEEKAAPKKAAPKAIEAPKKEAVAEKVIEPDPVKEEAPAPAEAAAAPGGRRRRF